jgi:hypothetical protein
MNATVDNYDLSVQVAQLKKLVQALVDRVDALEIPEPATVDIEPA